jgi:hypothetical protein
MSQSFERARLYRLRKYSKVTLLPKLCTITPRLCAAAAVLSRLHMPCRLLLKLSV